MTDPNGPFNLSLSVMLEKIEYSLWESQPMNCRIVCLLPQSPIMAPATRLTLDEQT
jgi:hypothetical protein